MRTELRVGCRTTFGMEWLKFTSWNKLEFDDHAVLRFILSCVELVLEAIYRHNLPNPHRACFGISPHEHYKDMIIGEDVSLNELVYTSLNLTPQIFIK